MLVLDEDAHQSDNTTGWTLDVIPPPLSLGYWIMILGG